MLPSPGGREPFLLITKQNSYRKGTFSFPLVERLSLLSVGPYIYCSLTISEYHVCLLITSDVTIWRRKEKKITSV